MPSLARRPALDSGRQPPPGSGRRQPGKSSTSRVNTKGRFQGRSTPWQVRITEITGRRGDRAESLEAFHALFYRLNHTFVAFLSWYQVTRLLDKIANTKMLRNRPRKVASRCPPDIFMMIAGTLGGKGALCTNMLAVLVEFHSLGGTYRSIICFAIVNNMHVIITCLASMSGYRYLIRSLAIIDPSRYVFLY